MADPIITQAQVTQRMVGLRPYLAQIEDIEEIIADRLRGTIADFQRELQMCVVPTVIKQGPADDEVEGVDYDLREPPLDWDRHHIGQLPSFRMRRRPIISVEKIALKLSEDYDLFQFPPGWYTQHIQRTLGIVSVVPVPVAGALLDTTGNMIYAWMMARTPWLVIPQAVIVNYTAGFANPATNPALDDFRMYLAEATALKVIGDIRDMLPSSVSLDGASQSFDTVQQRLESRQKDRDQFFKDWKLQHNPAPMVVI